MAATSGKNARATFSGQIFDNVSWEVTESGDVIDDTGTESNGYQHATPGTRLATARVDAFWNASVNQFTSPPGIAFGTELTTSRIYLNANATGSITTGSNWNLGTCLVTEVRNMSEVHGGVKLSFTCRTQGSYTTPAATS
jgi:hypothetical protein